MTPNRFVVAAVSLAAALSFVATTSTQEPVPLAYGIPADTHVFVHGRTSATPDPGTVRSMRAFELLFESGVHEDILDLATMDMGRGRAENVRATVHHVLDLLGRVDWATLMAQEIVFAERIAMPVPEYLLICRVPADQSAAHLARIRSMLEGLAEMAASPDVAVRSVESRAGDVVEMSMGAVPMQLSAGAAGDAIVISTGTRTTIAALRGLAGDGSRSIARNERYAASLAQLPAGTEAVSFVDMAGIMDFMSQLMGMAEAGASGDAEAAFAVRLIRSVIDEFDIIDHFAGSSVSDGATVTNTMLIQMREGYETSRVVALAADQRPWADWYRFVPADATSFVFDSGLDVGGLFDLVDDLAAESLGEGRQAPWSGHPLYRAAREKAGYVSGEVAWVTLPSEKGASSDTAVMLRLEKTDGVAEWLGAQLRWIARFLESKGQSMTITTEGDLHSVELAAFPWIHPVIGVRGDYLVAATSPGAIARVERVHRGEAPDIRTSGRFARLGIGGEGAGAYVDYAQLETGMGDLANVMSAAGFVLSLLPEERDTRPAIKLGAILTKLAPAMRELDMAFDYASEMRGTQQPDAFLSRSVVRYRDER